MVKILNLQNCERHDHDLMSDKNQSQESLLQKIQSQYVEEDPSELIR